jgi:hypothetical protein
MIERCPASALQNATAAQRCEALVHGTPWPGRTRPLCSYPSVAHYNGSGDIEKAENFTCVKPKTTK